MEREGRYGNHAEQRKGIDVRDPVHAAFRTFTGPLEGPHVPFMYLDDRHDPKTGEDLPGLVTVAWGNLIDPAPMALDLPFVKPDGSPATRAEKLACWNLVKGRQDLKRHGGMIFGRLAGNTLRMTDEAMDALVDRKLAQFDANLRLLFPAWDEWCCDLQLFGLSWAWAVGAHAAYPRMIRALNSGDFDTAVNECTINPQRGTVILRNAENRTLIRNASRVRAFGLDPGKLYWPTALDDDARIPRV